MPAIPTYHLFKLSLDDTINVSDTAPTKAIYKTMTDTANVSDSIAKLIDYTISTDTINASDSITKRINYVMDLDTVNVSDSITKLMYQLLSDVVNVSDTLVTIEFVLEKGLRADVEAIIDEYGEDVTLYTNTNTTDSSGNITANTETSDTGVTVLIQDMVAQDYDLIGKGIDYTGSAKMFAKYRYDLTNNGDDYQIKPGDKILRIYFDGTNRWDMTFRVEEVLRENVQESVVIFYEYLIRLMEIKYAANATTPTEGVETPIRADVLDIFNERAELTRLTITDTATDSMGGIYITEDTVDNDVKVIIQDVSARAREIIGKGVNLTGYATMFAMNNYDLTNNGDDYQIKPGDHIFSQARNATFRVETVVAFNVVGYGNAFMEYIVRRTDNENIV